MTSTSKTAKERDTTATTSHKMLIQANVDMNDITKCLSIKMHHRAFTVVYCIFGKCSEKGKRDDKNCLIVILTSWQLLQRKSNTSVEWSRFGRRVKCQSHFLIAHFPMVKRPDLFVKNHVSLYEAVKCYLRKWFSFRNCPTEYLLLAESQDR